jgi:hypothetical protein
MISLRQFLGALISEVTRARVISDSASAAVALRYLDHDLLKAFPIPRMQIKDLDVELHFAVAPGVEGVTVFAETAVRQHVRLQLASYLRTLPDEPDLKPHFDGDATLAQHWATESAALDPKFEEVMARPGADRGNLVRSLSLLIKNLVLTVALHSTSTSLLTRMREIFTRSSTAAGTETALDEHIRNAVEQTLVAVDTDDADGSALEDLFDLNVLVTADDLAKLDPRAIQKLKLTFYSSDRKWVVGDHEGEKKNLLTRD